jgi:hypothetical protein
MYLALKRFAESSMGPEDQTLLTLTEVLWAAREFDLRIRTQPVR